MAMGQTHQTRYSSLDMEKSCLFLHRPRGIEGTGPQSVATPYIVGVLNLGFYRVRLNLSYRRAIQLLKVAAKRLQRLVRVRNLAAHRDPSYWLF